MPVLLAFSYVGATGFEPATSRSRTAGAAGAGGAKASAIPAFAESGRTPEWVYSGVGVSELREKAPPAG
jgi:hypothetical protein